jgi:hypothetical protein
MAVVFKLQAVFFLPFLLLMYFIKKKFSCLYFLWIPVMMLLSGIPGTLAGRSPWTVFSIYLTQTDFYKSISLNYPSFWDIFQNAFLEQFYLDMKKPAIAFTVVVLAVLMLSWIVKKVPLSDKNMAYMAFLLSYTCVLFLPAMHERYGFLYEVLAILLLFYNKKTLPLMVGLYIISFSTYGVFLFGRSVNMTVLAIANTIVYIGYMAIIMSETVGDRKS